MLMVRIKDSSRRILGSNSMYTRDATVKTVDMRPLGYTRGQDSGQCSTGIKTLLFFFSIRGSAAVSTALF